ncbi:MAG: hypothetical protein V1908_02085 [Candidatus Peregrinibacteria bacterium]
MKTCKQCSVDFEITDSDRVFYAKMNVPEPLLCPDCRQQRRWAFRNQSKLYKRKCDLTGEEMVSLYSPDKPYKVYKESAWWSDQWDPLSYGRDFDFSRPFFEQMGELLLAVPRRGMHQDGTNENCEYTTFGASNKNSYMLLAGFYCEDVYYSTWTGMTKNSMDTLLCVNGGRAYECTDCDNCYECFYCHDSKNCQNSWMLENCKRLKSCIACKNLTDKEYYIYNQPASKADFEAMQKRLLEGYLAEEMKKFNQWKLQFPYCCVHSEQSENCSGDYFQNAKNCHDCFDVPMGAQDCSHCQMSGWGGKDLMDCTMVGKECELLYFMQATTTAYHSAFTNFCRYSSDVFYCDCVSACKDCFGCTGLRHKSYCLLNKQYSREEYERLLQRVIEHMKKTGEWGEFFPPHLSQFGYNETMAMEYFPLAKEEALKSGFKWSDYEPPAIKAKKMIPARRLPDTITNTPDDVLNWAILCEATQKPFKIIAQELKFYREMGLPIPHLHPDERHRRRMALRNPRKLYDRACMKCKKPIVTTYAPDRPEIVYCENCYLKEIY